MKSLAAILWQHRLLWLAATVPLIVLVWIVSGLGDDPPTPAPMPVDAMVSAAPPAGGVPIAPPAAAEIPPETPSTATEPPAGAELPAGEAAAPDAAPDIFAARSWEPELPPEAAAPAEPPPPEAPPLPFRYLGRIDESGQGTVYFLSHGERVLSVRSGETIDGTYQVGVRRNGQLPLHYRPMNIQQFLDLGSDS